MADRSAIEWTEATWNPVTGCSKVSPGCAHCYAEPLRWRRPRLIFVSSMSDLFHELVPAEFVDEVIAVMERAGQHTFQVLTKRPERARSLLVDGEVRPLPPNAWLGVSIENSRFTWRADV